MIAARDFHDIDTDKPGSDNYFHYDADGQNDGLWCQTSLDESMIGTWYYPNGSTVPYVSSSPLYSNNTPTGQIGLLRNGGISSIQGLYKCVIPNEEGINQTMYVAAYGNAEFDDNGKFILFTSYIYFHSFFLVKSFWSLMIFYSSFSHQLILTLQCLAYYLMSLIDHLQM